MFLNKVKIFLVISLIQFFFLLNYNNSQSQEITLIKGIAKVTDGDTIRIKTKKIRLLGIDAPEIKQQCQKSWISLSFLTFNKNYFCGVVSKEKLKNKINGKIVTCKITNKDRYNRFIAECFKGKINLNRWMVRNGHAVAYKIYSKKFMIQEDMAKNEKLGLWAGSFEMPWEWRKKH
tara:strand:+ start:34 stop:561 length:528 start_codon:yes stop_codon:yes gene_type:complete